MILFNDFKYCLYETSYQKYILKVLKNIGEIKNIEGD